MTDFRLVIVIASGQTCMRSKVSLPDHMPKSRCSRESPFHQALLLESFEHVPNLSRRGFLALRDLSGAQYQVVYGQDSPLVAFHVEYG